MGVQKRSSQFGLAEQTVKGTPMTSPTYVVGLVSGSPYMATINESNLDTTWSNRVNQGFDRTEVIPGAESEVVALPASIGSFLKAVMGACTTTGAGPYVHTYSPSNALTYWTLFTNLGASKVTIADAKADSLELSWDKSGAVKCKVKWMGITLTFAATFTGGTNEQVSAGPYRGAGGTFSVFGSSARVTSGTITIENALQAIIASSAVTPADIFEATIKTNISLKIIPDDLNEFRRYYTGTTAGTTAAASPPLGAVDVSFKSGTNILEFTAASVRFVAAMPTADANGGAVEIDLVGEVADPGTGSDPFNFVLTNSIATY